MIWVRDHDVCHGESSIIVSDCVLLTNSALTRLSGTTRKLSCRITKSTHETIPTECMRPTLPSQCPVVTGVS